MPTFQRPAPLHPGFETYTVLPELKGLTPGEMAARGMAMMVFCRACGREVVITPHGLFDLFPMHRKKPIEAVVRAMRCETCGAREAQASGWSLEGPDQRLFFVRRAHARAEFKRTG